MTELNLSLEHASASTDGPCHDWLGDRAILDSLNNTVFLNTTNLTKQKQDFALWLGLVSQQVVDEGCARISVTTNGNTFVYTIGVICNNVVQLIGHTTGFRDISD